MPQSKKVPNENEYETFVGGAYFVSPPLYSHSSAPKGSFQREKENFQSVPTTEQKLDEKRGQLFDQL